MSIGNILTKKPKMFSIKRNQVEDPLETVEIEITQLQKKTTA